MIIQHYLYWVSSFGYLRINVHLQLPVAFRSLSRPSSAPCTKASSCMLFVAYSFSNISSLLTSYTVLFFSSKKTQNELSIIYSRINSSIFTRIFVSFCLLYFVSRLYILENIYTLLCSCQSTHPTTVGLSAQMSLNGGLEWTRTIDLTLIRRVL